LSDARRELHAAILEANAEGHSTSVIAKVAGLSRQRVDQIIRRG
jgi:Homeodomain-like domain